MNLFDIVSFEKVSDDWIGDFASNTTACGFTQLWSNFGQLAAELWVILSVFLWNCFEEVIDSIGQQFAVIADLKKNELEKC